MYNFFRIIDNVFKRYELDNIRIIISTFGDGVVLDPPCC